jgi:hypothetical protein
LELFAEILTAAFLDWYSQLVKSKIYVCQKTCMVLRTSFPWRIWPILLFSSAAETHSHREHARTQLH